MAPRFNSAPARLSLAIVLLAAAAAQTIEYETQREHWQNIAGIFEAMAIGPGSLVADVGCGDGFLTLRLAPRVGENGRVYAVDIAADRLERVEKRAADAHLANVVTVRSAADDPRLPPAQLDAVVILNAYHEMPKHEEMLRHIREALKPGGRLVISEPSPAEGEDTRSKQISKHQIASSFVAEEMTGAGFTGVTASDQFAKTPDGGYYSLVVGRRAGSGSQQ